MGEPRRIEHSQVQPPSMGGAEGPTPSLGSEIPKQSVVAKQQTQGSAATPNTADHTKSTLKTGLGYAMVGLAGAAGLATLPLSYPLGGIGLGLYATRQIIGRHGGTITFDSTPDGTTTFTVRLPRAS